MKSRPSRARGLKHGGVCDLVDVHVVAPFTGAWIETCRRRRWRSRRRSRPSRARGLKLGGVSYQGMTPVAPFTGAWIETCRRGRQNRGACVAPFTGAWIETGCRRAAWSRCRSRPSRARGLKLPCADGVRGGHVAPFTGAWIETVPIPPSRALPRSRPSRARGLKRQTIIRSQW